MTASLTLAAPRPDQSTLHVMPNPNVGGALDWYTTFPSQDALTEKNQTEIGRVTFARFAGQTLRVVPAPQPGYYRERVSIKKL